MKRIAASVALVAILFAGSAAAGGNSNNNAASCVVVEGVAYGTNLPVGKEIWFRYTDANGTSLAEPVGVAADGQTFTVAVPNPDFPTGSEVVSAEFGGPWRGRRTLTNYATYAVCSFQ